MFYLLSFHLEKIFYIKLCRFLETIQISTKIYFNVLSTIFKILQIDLNKTLKNKNRNLE